MTDLDRAIRAELERRRTTSPAYTFGDAACVIRAVLDRCDEISPYAGAYREVARTIREDIARELGVSDE